MLRLTLLAFLSSGSVLMAEADRTPADWVEELSAAYAKLGSFVATYRSVGEGKHLDATLAMDEESGLALIHMEATNKGIRQVARHWNNADDDFFMDAGDGRVMKAPAMRAKLQANTEALLDALSLPSTAARKPQLHYSPSLFLTKNELNFALGLGSTREPSWQDHVEGAALKAIDAETVTFETKELGLVTIGREHGLLTRQSITADDGEVRVLELQDVTLNPETEAVAQISASWSTEDAVATPIDINQQFDFVMRVTIFQSLIGSVEDGKIKLTELETLLTDRADPLREFAATCVIDAGGLLDEEELKALLDSADVAIREFWLQADPQAKDGDEAAYAAFRAREDVRSSFRDQVVTALVNIEGGKHALIDPVLGPKGEASLTAATASGRAAKAAIETAIATAYCEAFLDSAMAARWGPATE